MRFTSMSIVDDYRVDKSDEADEFMTLREEFAAISADIQEIRHDLRTLANAIFKMSVAELYKAGWSGPKGDQDP
jgi:hypothetical protein